MGRFSRGSTVLAAVCCLAVPPRMLQQALAMTAGTLFEAAPFVLAVGLGRAPWARWPAALFGCGCGPLGGSAALSLPATALCWALFGPWPALARFAGGVAVEAIASARRRARSDSQAHGACAAEPGPDPLRALSAIGPPTVGLSLVIVALQDGAPMHAAAATSLGAMGELAVGAAIGAFAPCSTTAVALAGMLRVAAPAASAAILATAGIVPQRRAAARSTQPRRDARPVLAALALACGVLAMRHGNGFVHPRLVPLLWAAAAAALVATRIAPQTSGRRTALVPAAMLVALVIGSPAPSGIVSAGTLDDAYPGERIAFTGVATRIGGRTALVRYAITCCRADATAIVVPTDLTERLENATWISAVGTIVRDRADLSLRISAWHRIAPPSDPFVYR